MCPQAFPAWYQTAAQFLPAYLSGNASSLDLPASGAPPPPNTPTGSMQAPPTTSGESEDCLFLDVLVPKRVLDARGGGNGRGKGNGGKGDGAPVLVYIHGGGFVTGTKGGDGDPAGLISKSLEGGAPGVVYVQMNYRVCFGLAFS
jgi:carboxylesterase type B